MILVSALTLTLTAQQRDSRPAAVPSGAGEISGVVYSADARPQPIRRVIVSISGGDIGLRSVITGDDGRFVFGKLPAGSYAVTAKKAAYLAAEFGSGKPGRPGSRVALTAGERRAISLTMFRGAAIGGTIRDPNGNPVGGVTVNALDARTIGTNVTEPTPISVTSDDRGAYRIFGLMPGEYVVFASPTAAGDGEIGVRPSAEIDAAIAALTQRQARTAPAGVAAPPIPLAPSASIGYAPIYFPGTPQYSEAARLRVAAGDDRSGANFTVSHVPVASIEGIVSGNVLSLAQVQLSLMPEGPKAATFMNAGGITAQPPNDKGEFSYGNLAPGRYRIVARGRVGGPDVNPLTGTAGTGRAGISGGAPPPGVVATQTGDILYAVADVDVRGQRVTGVSLALQPGGSLAGRIVFDSAGTPVPDDFTTLRMQASILGGSYVSQRANLRIGNALSSILPAAVDADGAFTITGIGPSAYSLNCLLPPDLQPFWKVRSAIVDGRDLLDGPIDGPFVNYRGVVVTLSDKRTEIGGTLSMGPGQPATEFFVIAFSTDRANWRSGARRSQSTRPATDGRFVFADLPAGEYFIAALTDLEPSEWQDAAFLEQVAPAAVRVKIGEGQKIVQNLQVK